MFSSVNLMYIHNTDNYINLFFLRKNYEISNEAASFRLTFIPKSWMTFMFVGQKPTTVKKKKMAQCIII